MINFFFYYVTELIIYDVQSFINLLFAFPVAFFFKQYIPVVIGMGFVCGYCKPYFARISILNFWRVNIVMCVPITSLFSRRYPSYGVATCSVLNRVIMKYIVPKFIWSFIWPVCVEIKVKTSWRRWIYSIYDSRNKHSVWKNVTSAIYRCRIR